ncbi:MAG: dihydrodipicolinate synthase family protein [Candidatus Hadarchaeum sp.]
MDVQNPPADGWCIPARSGVDSTPSRYRLAFTRLLTGGTAEDRCAEGAAGVDLGGRRIIKKKVVRLVDSFRAGDVETARRLNDELMPLFKSLFIETNPVPVKTAMNWMGMPAGGCRLPLVEMQPENQEKLRRVLVEMGLLR